MAIRVSYKGADGSSRSVVARNPFDAAEKISKLTGNVGVNDGNLGGANGFAANAGGVKTSVGGSVKNTVRGIELDGDTRRHAGVGPGVYATLNGKKGWYSADELDPRVFGGSIGDPTSNNPDPQQDNKSENDVAPFTESFVSRIIIEKRVKSVDEEGDDGSTVTKTTVSDSLWAFVRDRAMTRDGREFFLSEERKIYIGEINAGGLGIGGEVSFLGDVRFHDYEFQKRVDTLDLATGTVTEGEYEKMEGGDTVPHSTGAY